MSPETFVLLSGVLTYGVPIALGVRELVLLRRHGGTDPRRRDPAPATDPVPPTGGAPALPPPLPDCLIPRLPEGAAPAAGQPKERVLEPA